jgi:DNA-binding transcriptional LysR family regulator
MELMQLRMLLAAADGESLQKAGQAVGRTPQAVGMAIDKLENELGVSLFHAPAGKGQQLTAAGMVLADYARRSLALLDEAISAVEDIRTGRSGCLRIGSNQSIGEYVLPQITDIFRRKHPAVKLKVTIDYSDSILASLARNEFDIALVANAAKGKDLHSTLLMVDRVVAVMSPRHRLAQREQLGIEDLAGESLILLDEASELHERIVQTFRRFQTPMNPSVVTSTLESIKRMVAQDIGIGIVPRLCVGQETARGGLAVKTIAEFSQDRELWMVYPRNRSPASRALASIVEGMYHDQESAVAPVRPAKGAQTAPSCG